MKVFVAGASGVIGRPTVRRLVAAGHEVVGMTRREERAGEIRAAGAEAVVCDAFDAEGNLTKEPMQKVMQQYIDAFAAFVEKQNG